ncbi:MAG TPA: sodium:solute symporter family protein [Alloacidobacterium sp.]|nr:sodium:solute symporter family protein [Alloacidobacterium sp.]
MATMTSGMSNLDWAVLCAFFILMLGLGLWARTRIRSASDYFSAGGEMPWWLSGISHHMSGYSSAAFVGYAAIAYSTGFTIYVWWASTITLAMLIGYSIFPPRWAKLRQVTGMISPLEYLVIRYNLSTQQALAWSGSLLKVFDVGAKWTATAILLHVFAGVPPVSGVLLTGGVTLAYAVAGGLWANAITDFSQFCIQLVAGSLLLAAVLSRLGGIAALWTIWDHLPPSHAHAFVAPYTPLFAVSFLVINTLSYNGGTWNLAQRFIAAPTGNQAKKAALLSAGLYLIWPLVLFFPMWAGPLLTPVDTNPSDSYALLVLMLLPHGLIGLVLAGLFAQTMAMTSSDANAISAVVVRDILPALRRDRIKLNDASQLLAGRICTFAFLAVSMIIAIFADRFGGVLGLVILWFAALLGPIAVPMLFGMLLPFRRCGSGAALAAWLGGIVSFALIRFAFLARITSLAGDMTTAINVGGPVVVAMALYVLLGAFTSSSKPAADALLDSINRDLIADQHPKETQLTDAGKNSTEGCA